jgi:hypothetical protein
VGGTLGLLRSIEVAKRANSAFRLAFSKSLIPPVNDDSLKRRIEIFVEPAGRANYVVFLAVIEIHDHHAEPGTYRLDVRIQEEMPTRGINSSLIDEAD